MKRLLGIASICVLTGVACGGDPTDGPDEGEETNASRHPTSGFTTFSSPPSSPDAGTWDFTMMPDNSAGETCDPADPEACSEGLMCCPAGRGGSRCMQPIRIGDCPKEPSGPSGGHSNQRGPFVPR